MFSAALKGSNEGPAYENYHKPGWLISGIGEMMEALYHLQRNAECVLERMPEQQAKGEAA